MAYWLASLKSGPCNTERDEDMKASMPIPNPCSCGHKPRVNSVALVGVSIWVVKCPECMQCGPQEATKIDAVLRWDGEIEYLRRRHAWNEGRRIK